MKEAIIPVDNELSLHPPLQKYAQEMFDLIDQQRDQLREWLSWVDRIKELKDVQIFLRDAGKFNKGGQRFTTLIFYQDLLVGSVALVRIHKIHQVAEIGYWLDQRYQGRGIATKACQSLMKYAFEQLNMNRLEIKIIAGNDKSQGVPERLGFFLEGTLRERFQINNRYYDVKVFSLLKREWQE